MLFQSINRPAALETAGITSAVVTLTSVPPPARFVTDATAAGYGADWESVPLVINDCTALDAADGENQLASFPYSTLLTLGQGGTIAVGETSNGLTISQVPPGVAVSVATVP
jgi:hypothetical protein